MVDARRGAVGHGGPVRRGRGRPRLVETDAVEGGAQGPRDAEIPAPQPEEVLRRMDRAALIEMLRGLVGDPPPEAPEV